jgi:hypothetical protein
MLLDKISGYDLNYSLTHSLKWKFFEFKTCTGLYYFILNFYQINKNNKIQNYNRLVIKVFILFYNNLKTKT